MEYTVGVWRGPGGFIRASSGHMGIGLLLFVLVLVGSATQQVPLLGVLVLAGGAGAGVGGAGAGAGSTAGSADLGVLAAAQARGADGDAGCVRVHRLDGGTTHL